MGADILNPYSAEKREECGIVGIYSKKGLDVAPHIYRALIALQHRGQDAAGLAVFDGKNIEARRGVGLVSDVFEAEDLRIRGALGIGHTRYPTHGQCRLCDVQPMVLGDIAAAHNGHIANYPQIRKELEASGRRFSSSVDSEAIVFMLEDGRGLRNAVAEMMKRLEGSYSVAAIFRGRLLVFRDPFAIRPLVWGENDDFICFASETVALDINGIPYRGDVRGGEMVLVGGGKAQKRIVAPETPRHCMFEYVYFARPDSCLDGKGVYAVRQRLGRALAKEAPAKADVVVPVPDTSRTAAAAYASALQIPCEEGLIKNRYIGRTFIMPSQAERMAAVALKLNPLRDVVSGNSVVLVDDSIVRGTTLKEIVALVRDAGAKEIHLRITCPPIRAPCFYGVDMSEYGELIANKKTTQEIRDYLGADSLAYLSQRGLADAIGIPLCTACLSGRYLTKKVREMARARCESGK